MNHIFTSQESLFSFYLEGSHQSQNNCNSDSLVTGWCREDISPSTDYSVHTAVHRPAPLTEDPHWAGQCCGASIMWTSVHNIIWRGVTAHAHTQLSVWWLPPLTPIVRKEVFQETLNFLGLNLPSSDKKKSWKTLVFSCTRKNIKPKPAGF